MPVATTIRDEPDADAPAVLEVVRRAFGADGEEVAAIWAELRASGSVRACLVTEVDGAVVGHVGVSPCWVDARRALVDALVLSPSRPPRGRGRAAGVARSGHERAERANQTAQRGRHGE